MEISDIEKMIRSVLGTGYGRSPGSGSGENEVAVKCYFYPWASALLTTEQWESIILEDDIHVRPEKAEWVAKTFAEQFARIVRVMRLDVKPGGEHYISFIVYGMVVGGEGGDKEEDFDFVVHVDGVECVPTISYSSDKPQVATGV